MSDYQQSHHTKRVPAITPSRRVGIRLERDERAVPGSMRRPAAIGPVSGPHGEMPQSLEGVTVLPDTNTVARPPQNLRHSKNTKERV